LHSASRVTPSSKNPRSRDAARPGTFPEASTLRRFIFVKHALPESGTRMNDAVIRTILLNHPIYMRAPRARKNLHSILVGNQSRAAVNPHHNIAKRLRSSSSTRRAFFSACRASNASTFRPRWLPGCGSHRCSLHTDFGKPLPKADFAILRNAERFQILLQSTLHD